MELWATACTMDRNGIVNSVLQQFSYLQNVRSRTPASKEFVIAPPTKSRLYKVRLALLAFFGALLSFYRTLKDPEPTPFTPAALIPFILLCFSFILGVNLLWTVEKESLLLTVPISLQLSTTYLCGRQSTTYIPWHRLKDFLIIDVITGQQVLYYLAATLLPDNSTDGETHVILFRHTRPRLAYLEKMYREIQYLLDANR